MLIVDVRLAPHGNVAQLEELGRVLIANDLTGTTQLGNYTVVASQVRKLSKVWKRTRLQGHDRSQSPYHLVHAALQAILGDATDAHASRPVRRRDTHRAGKPIARPRRTTRQRTAR